MYPLVLDLAVDSIGVAVTCRVLGFSKQAFYRWRADPVCQRDWDDAHLINAAVDIHHDDPEFGYRFIRDELADQGVVASRNRVNRLCTQQRLWSVHSRKRGTGRKPGPLVHDDLVLWDFTAAAPNLLWLTDITEHPTAQGKLYLCAVKDACSKRIVGYSISDRMTAQLAVNALRNALALRGQVQAIVHSDRGSQGELNWPSQHLEREVMRCHLAASRGRSVPTAVRSRLRVGRRLPGGRTGFGSGRRSGAAHRPMLRRWRPACRRRLATAGFVTLAG